MLETEIRILRRRSAQEKPFWQTVLYCTDNSNASVATALTDLNRTPDLQDRNGKPVEPIVWECSCLQKKCGACAMVINGIPRLACDARLKEFRGRIRLEPLHKFPIVADLMVDRSILFENLKTLKLWLTEAAETDDRGEDTVYEASRCLQCGCCLEICPNFYAGGTFTGTASMVPAAKLISELPESQRKELHRAYTKHFFEGCGKSLACRNICPAGIDIDHLLARSNAIAVWKRRR